MLVYSIFSTDFGLFIILYKKNHEKPDKHLKSSVFLKPHGLWSAWRGSLHAFSHKQEIIKS